MCIYIYTVEQHVQDHTILYRQPLEEEIYNNGMCVPLVCLYLVLCMYMCVCVYVCAYACMHMYVCICVRIVYMYVCMCLLCMYVCG